MVLQAKIHAHLTTGHMNVRHMVRCGWWLFVSETWKIRKVRNCFPRYLRQIFMDICFLYIILKCISSPSISFIVCPSLSRFRELSILNLIYNYKRIHKISLGTNPPPTPSPPISFTKFSQENDPIHYQLHLRRLIFRSLGFCLLHWKAICSKHETPRIMTANPACLTTGQPCKGALHVCAYRHIGCRYVIVTCREAGRSSSYQFLLHLPLFLNHLSLTRWQSARRALVNSIRVLRPLIIPRC